MSALENSLDNLEIAVAAIIKENEKLRKAVLTYSTHTNDCGRRYGHDCDCGLETLRKQLNGK